VVSVEYFGARLACLPFPPKKSANGDGTATRSAREQKIAYNGDREHPSGNQDPI